MLRKIIDVKNPILRRTSKRVNKIDKKIKSLAFDMRETLAVQDDPEGVGLAAPQVGKNIRMFLIKYGKIDQIFINPEIIDVSYELKAGQKKQKDVLEGCLSLPHYYGPLKRATKVKLRYQDEEGAQHEKVYKGFYAQIVQHEVDHLNGILFIDRIIEQESPLYKFSGDSWEEVEL